ncbi:MAG TPA: HAMP domain-containing sensor histidine kinase [Amycolatopsis sp.]|nr:HAMP domain-containing sensor histidine kinase [Amycolatopsis sp.]
MSGKRDFGLWASGPVSAARQAALLFALTGLVTVPGALGFPERAFLLLTIGAINLAIAVVAWSLPWQRWAPLWPAVLALPALGVLAVVTWAIGGFASGTAPFLVLVFVWLGLNFPPWVTWSVVPVGTAAYLVPLALGNRPNVVIGSTFVMIPVVVGIALLVGRQVTHLNVARQQLSREAEWRSDLSATLAHDVRSPLTALELALDELGGGDLSGEQRHVMAETARRQAGRIKRLTTSLLDLKRLDTSGALRLDLRTLRLREAVEHALTYLRSGQVTVDIDPDLLVAADPDRFEQIVFNLANNALTHAGPPVRVSARPADGQLRIEVRDFGRGVPPEVVPTLFTRFTSSDRSPQSVGLGLWISRELARAHGGDVHYEPADPGARFVITLPAAAPGRDLP